MNIGGPQRSRLHHRDRGCEGRGADHAAAAHGRRQGPRPRLLALLRAICRDQAVAADGDAAAVGQGAAAVARRSRRSWTGCTSASCAPAARRAARAIGGTATSSWGRRSCSRPIAGLPTAATR
jgi:hypothetical protein